MVYRVTTEYFQEDPSLILKFQNLSRDHWNDYIWRNRNYLVSSLANLPDFDTALDWAYKNDSAIASTVSKYYGDGNGQKFFETMSAFTGVMASMMVYLKKPPANFNFNTDPYFLDLKKKWLGFAVEIAVILSALNPQHWKQPVVEKIFTGFVDLWLAQIMSRSDKNWIEDIKSTDQIYTLSREFADIFADGVIQQNPEKFSVV